MRCLDFEERMQLLLDHRCRPDHDSALRIHAAVCNGCQRALEAQRSLFAQIDLSSTTELPGGMATAVLNRLTEQRQLRRQRLRRGVACTLAACLVSILFVRHDFRQIAKAPKLDTLPGVTAQPAAALPDTRQPPHQSQIEPKVTTDSKWTGRTVNLALQQWKTPLAQWNANSSLSLHQIADRLRPITSSFSIALNALRRTLPGRYSTPPTKPQTRRLGTRQQSLS
ncbi:MAG: hypothetical protein CMJ75_02740 [Planctomycetaceae bacterium]|nr:hypothetical protein [Planctomycetaceae bacterium]